MREMRGKKGDGDVDVVWGSVYRYVVTPHGMEEKSRRYSLEENSCVGFKHAPNCSVFVPAAARANFDQTLLVNLIQFGQNKKANLHQITPRLQYRRN